ncbi:MAG: Pr6Pr family membrane protein [Lachnospiraceae bacterium]|nr:Pr6Pr family membrane protein [Lachnospiraceae bacterium]
MYIKSNKINLIYRVVYLFICGLGVVNHLSLDDKVRNINMLSYFTIQSNIICFFVMLCSIFHSFASVRRGRYHDYARVHLFLKGLALVMITITFLTYNLVLTGTGFSMTTGFSAALSFNDRIVHFIIPAMTWIEFLLFQPKGGFKIYDPFKWLLAPVIYFIFIMIKARYVSPATYGVGIKRYPYFFMDVETYGVWYVVKYVLIFTVATLAISYVIRTIDFILGLIYTKIQKFRIAMRQRRQGRREENVEN